VNKVRFNGFEYPIVDELTNREMMLVEKIAECNAAAFSRAFSRDYDDEPTWGMLCALAFVSIKRAGASIKVDDLLDATPEAIDFEWGKATSEAPEGPSSNPLPAKRGRSAATKATPAESGSQS